jgi:hypothetical protein
MLDLMMLYMRNIQTTSARRAANTVSECRRCGEPRPLTHRVTSCILDMLVCEPCGMIAEAFRARQHPVGKISVMRGISEIQRTSKCVVEK